MILKFNVKGLYIDIYTYMVQYVIFQHFDQKLQKTENFFLATISNVKHLMSSYISIFFAEGLGCQKIQVSAFRCNLGCAPYALNWVFFANL